ncbi:MAG TPA: pantoate--beta-alanine ligase [Actinomycetes bacterium]|nr:pantoate--beta-alanine ligase [Actinomycetes bacterium]
MTTRVAHTRADLQDALHERSGEVGVVMTMGALHDGHRELISVARKRCDVIVVTVFLNPLQFAPGEDLSRYPKTLDRDVELCTAEDVDIVFAPSVAEVYPRGEQPQVRVHAGPLGEVLEGASRPGHFDGVLTVVAKLLHMTAPDVAYFGQKDAQQLLLIRRMTEDLDFPVEVVAVPTVRQPDGLALSSRNGYLSPEDRQVALALSRALRAGEAAAAEGAAAVRGAALRVLEEQPGLGLDYLALVDPSDLADVADEFTGPALLAVAAKVGTTRLIDNLVVTVGGA